MKNFLSLLLLFTVAYSYGQAPKKPCFKVYDVATKKEINAICLGQKIKVVNCDPVPPNTIQYYDYDKEDGVPFTPSDTVNTHTFTQSKRFLISFLPTYENSSISDSIIKAFQVLPLPAPLFEVQSCTQRQVQVTITDQVYDAFEVRFAGGTSTTIGKGASTTHQFAAGLPMQVTVVGRYNGSTCAGYAEKTVQELPSPASPRLARVQVQVPDRTIGRMSIGLEQLQSAYIYLIEKQNGTGFTVLDTIKYPGTPEINRVFDKVNALDQGCFRIRVTDACGTLLNTISNTICSLPARIESSTQNISLSWPPYPDQAQISGFQLYRNGQLYSSLPPTQLNFQDEKVSCHQQYCYELVALLPNNTQSVSNKPCTSLTTSPPLAAAVLNSTFTPDNQVKVIFQVPANQVTGQIRFEKSINGGAFSSWMATTDRFAQDNSIKENQAICYQAVYQDSCDQVSPVSNITCPVVLQTSPGENNAVELTWSSYAGHPGTVQYVLQRLDAGGQVLSSTPVSGNSYQDVLPDNSNQKLFYRIQGLLNGQAPTYSNTESVAFEGKVWVPTAFSPNGDNLNDVFEVKGRFIQVTSLRIYDRWGQVIYQSQGQGWNGHINGREAPAGTYPYLLEWKDENNRTMSKKGLVTLVK